MELGCGQTRSFLTPGIGFGGFAFLGYAGSVGFSIGPGGRPPRKIDASFPLSRALGLGLRNQSAAKATSATSALKSTCPAHPSRSSGKSSWGGTGSLRLKESGNGKEKDSQCVFYLSPLISSGRGDHAALLRTFDYGFSLVLARF